MPSQRKTVSFCHRGNYIQAALGMTCSETYEAIAFAYWKKKNQEKKKLFLINGSCQWLFLLPSPAHLKGFSCFHWQVAASPAGLLYSSCCPYLPPLQYKAAEERERLQDKSQSWSEPDEREE